ncbi:decarboxylase [Alphaproteobacteria bacterium]|nr:decarboxylase [Alphaproteobacteria bacterium]
MTVPPSAEGLSLPSGDDIIAQLKKAGIEIIVSVPDIVTSDGLLWPISKDPDFQLIRVCKEDEGVSICAALSYSNTRALLLMQQTGLMDSLNAIRAIAMDYHQPVCMMVGMQGKAANETVLGSASYGVRIIPPILDVMGLNHIDIDSNADTNNIAPAIDSAYATGDALCFIIGQSPVIAGGQR